MCMCNVLLAGAHRGALSIVHELKDETVRRYDPQWRMADPKPDRAVQLGRMAQDRFPTLRPQPLQMRAQDALVLSRDHDSVVLAMDTFADTLETLEARFPAQRVLFQLVGRGPGGAAGTRLAVRGTICPEDHDTERAARLFLHTLAGMSPAASSRRLTDTDPLSAVALQPLRKAASRQTAKHLAEKDREPWELSGGPLSVCFGQTAFPLLPVQGQSQDAYSQWKDRALDTVGELPADHFISRGLRGGFAMVAVVIPDARAIHFLKVAQNRTGKRSVAGVTSLVLPRVQQPSKPAAFTD